MLKKSRRPKITRFICIKVEVRAAVKVSPIMLHAERVVTLEY